ncbi:MAG: methyltransferase [Caldilineaceae bacterium]
MDNATKPLAPHAIYEMAANYFMIARTIQVAAELDIFTPLARQASTAAELAQAIKSNVRGIEMLLVACTALGLLDKQGDRYRTSAAAHAMLVQGEPGYAGHLLAGSVGVYQDWLKLDEAVRTGQPVARPSREKDAESLRQFVIGMHLSSQTVARFVANNLDLRDKKKVVDVGGGAGAFAIALCQQYPQLTATVLDLPEVTAIAQEVIAQAGLAQRIRTRSTDYVRDPIPLGHDVVLFCNVLHQEDAETVQLLLQKAYSALNGRGSVVILDVLLNETKTGPLSVALGALNNLIHNRGGEVHSGEELQSWLRKAGFGAAKLMALPFPDLSLLTAVKTK